MHKSFIKVEPALACLQDQVAFIVSPVLRPADFPTLFPNAWKWCHVLHNVIGFVLDFPVISSQLLYLLRGEYVFDYCVTFFIKVFQVLGYVSIRQIFIGG